MLDGGREKKEKEGAESTEHTSIGTSKVGDDWATTHGCPLSACWITSEDWMEPLQCACLMRSGFLASQQQQLTPDRHSRQGTSLETFLN